MCPYKPITVTLFRCNDCGIVQAVEVNPMCMRMDGRVVRPGYNCACGGVSWTRIKEVV